ncbi:CER 2 [Spatholobus suberectus]|nr:CER 2 [Spatholobus suberectus]
MTIKKMIEEAILDADRKGIKVLSLGLMNQGQELNIYGGLYVSRHPKLKVKVVDGSSLAVAVVLNSIPKGTTQVLLRGKLTKVAYALAFTLCQQGIKVATIHKDDYMKLKNSFNNSETNLIIANNYTQMTWLVGDELTEEEQLKASKGTLFIPYSQFPPRKYRKDCFYHCTPAMLIPSRVENVHSCEDWLPRRVMSAWRIAGIVHSLEGWSEHDCSYTMHNIDKVWCSTLQHGFQPLTVPIKESELCNCFPCFWALVLGFFEQGKRTSGLPSKMTSIAKVK